MQRRRAFYGGAILCAVVAFVVAADDSSSVDGAPDASAVTSLTIQVTLPDGLPAVGILVHEFGLERYTIYEKEIGPTGPDGTVRVEFQPGRHPDVTAPLGYGVFRFLLKPEAYRWELSDIYCWAEFDRSRDIQGWHANSGGAPDYEKWFEPGNDGTWPDREPSSNWSYGRGVPVRRDTPLLWKVQLQPGDQREVTVVDQYEKLVADATVDVEVDLSAHSHTGSGAEVYVGRLHTDSRGRFTMEHVGDFAYQFQVWGGGMLYDPDDYHLDPRLSQNLAIQGTTLRFKRPEIHNLQFVVRRARDGKPLSDVFIAPGITFPSGTLGYPPLGATGQDGTFCLDWPYPVEHVSWFTLERAGYFKETYLLKRGVPTAPIVVELEPRGTVKGRRDD